MKRQKGEPPAPTVLDEMLSRSSLRSSPWVLRRIAELGLTGRLVKGWTPPIISVSLTGDRRSNLGAA